MNTTLDDLIVERLDFLKEQLAGEDDPAYIRTFQAQIKILQNAPLDRLDQLIAMRRKHVKECKNGIESDQMFAELEALEWLQRQAARHG